MLRHGFLKLLLPVDRVCSRIDQKHFEKIVARRLLKQLDRLSRVASIRQCQGEQPFCRFILAVREIRRVFQIGRRLVQTVGPNKPFGPVCIAA